ncbi:MAG: hypothetical protein K2X38_12800 [Gemmataceae bacterium]|nr:hypothetical protein [Gemmataceae bacterium]
MFLSSGFPCSSHSRSSPTVRPLREFIEESRKFCDGWVSFYWGKTIEQNEKAGDLNGALVAQWLRYFRAKGPEMTGRAKE